MNLVTLGVRDLAASKAFYEKLGWKPSSAGNENVVFFKSTGTTLALFGRDPLADDAGVDNKGEGFRSFSIAQNVRTKEEVEVILKEAERARAFTS
jgi:catechol 2,3-dioxygenase-like lactoylglutathione lyase family enzyme